MSTHDDRQRPTDSSQRMFQIAEREIGRIILDIHDGPVQNIFAALSHLNSLRRQAQRRSDAAVDIERIDQVIGLLEHSLDEIRTFMGTFRPPEFERRSLLSVLEGLAIQHEELTSNPVVFDASEELPSVSLPTKIALYRIMQEALSNGSRHGGAKEHRVSIRQAEQMLIMEVSDQGSGFDVSMILAAQEGVHIGIEGMRERAKVLGGSFDVQSAPGQGTTVRVTVPCG